MTPRKYFVYKITNLVNPKLYIGKTTDNLKKRFNAHKTAARKQDPKDYGIIHRAMNKYGFDKFKIELIEECASDEEALSRETYYIALYKTNVCKYGDDFGYNLTDGGDGICGHKHTEEYKQAISERMVGLYAGEKNPFYGKHHSDETKLLISEHHKKQYQDDPEKYDAFNIKQCDINREQCLEIQRKYLEGATSMEKLAELYDSNLHAMHNIIHGKYVAIRGHSIITEEDIKRIKKERDKALSKQKRKISPKQEQEIINYAKARSKTQKEVAAMYGVSITTIRKIEQGRYLPNK